MRFRMRLVMISVLCGFVFLLYAAFVVAENRPAATRTPPFPGKVKGVPVVWVPDKEARATVRGLTENDIEYLRLYRGGSWSGLPQSLVVRDKRVIRAFIKGINAAVKRSDNIYWKRLSSNSAVGLPSAMIPHDALVLHTVNQETDFDQFELTLPFAADVIEGENWLLDRGTVSPEFQDALRQAGVPLPGAVHGIEKLISDTWLEIIGA